MSTSAGPLPVPYCSQPFFHTTPLILSLLMCTCEPKCCCFAKPAQKAERGPCCGMQICTHGYALCCCRWVQGECRRLGDTDAPEVDPMLQRAASALRERPMLFKYCAAEVAGARHNALFQRCARGPCIESPFSILSASAVMALT